LNDEAALREYFYDQLGETESCWLVLARMWRVDPNGWLPRILATDGDILIDTESTGVRVIQWRRSGWEGN